MPHGNTEPGDPNQARNNAICYLATSRVVGKPQSQTSLDDGERQDSPTPPYMQSRPNRSPAFSDVDGMVKSAENGLEEEGGDDSETDNGVVFMDLYVIA